MATSRSRRSDLRSTSPSPTDLSGVLLRQVPPHSNEAEQAVFGGVLLQSSILDRLSGQLRDIDFYLPAHQAIWRAMQALWSASRPVDVVSLAHALTQAGDLDMAGGPAYLGELLTATVSPTNALHHAGIIRDLAKRRAMIRMGVRMVEIGFDLEQQPADFVEIAGKASEAVLKDRMDMSGETPAEFLNDYFDYLENLQKTGGDAVPSPYQSLNQYIHGFCPRELIVVGGRPGEGKTAVALNIAYHAAWMGYPVGVFSLEMGKFELVSRMFASGAEVDSQHFRDGRFTDEEYSKLYALANDFKNLPISFYDQPATKPSAILAACRRWKRERGLRLAIVDYVQMVESEERLYSREQQVSSVSRAMKCMARELGIPVILLAQVNREVEKRTVKRLTKADLRESGALEQDADIIILIQPPEPGSEKMDVVRTWLTVDKSRSSRTGSVKIEFVKAFMKFNEV